MPTKSPLLCTLALGVVLPILACSGGSEPAGEPAPSVPATEPAPVAEEAPASTAAAQAPGQHCVEFTHFSCAVAGGKVLNLCEEEGSLVYFFGAIGSVEKEYPGFGDTPSWTYAEPSTVSAAGNSVSFSPGSHSFEVVEMVGAGGPNAEANNFAGVIVSKGGETVSTISCVGPVSSDWARIALLAAQ